MHDYLSRTDGRLVAADVAGILGSRGDFLTIDKMGHVDRLEAAFRLVKFETAPKRPLSMTLLFLVSLKHVAAGVVCH